MADAIAVLRELEDGEQVPEGHSLMEVLGTSGDTKFIWDKSNRDETENARRTFADFKAKRFLAFRAIGEDGRKGEQIYDFDPKAERLIFVPPIVGG